MNNKLSTKFAPAPRDPKELVLEQKAIIEASEFLDQVMAKTPFMFFILNDKRQVVYSNHLLMKHLGFEDMSEMVGFRPGELFSCIHSDTEPAGCGTAESCRYCGAIVAVLQSEKSNELVVNDAILNLKHNGQIVAANFRVSSKPFKWHGDTFFIVTLEDISSFKRMEMLEKTFFHDIKNKAGTVSGFLHLLASMEPGEKNQQFLKIAERGITELIEEVDYQQSLKRAESGDLEVKEQKVSARQVLEDILEDYRELAKKYEVGLKFDPSDQDFEMHTDPVLLKRVLANLVKNAIEASSSGDEVTAGCWNDEGTFTFCVANPAVMPFEVKSQIFSRSFSTKGSGRGIGTYSIRMLTEDYLKGKVSFTSAEPVGTRFYLTFPE